MVSIYRIIGYEYKILSEAYQDKFDFENRVNKLVDSFDRIRIEKITRKWWNKKIFKEKQIILEAGINAFLRGGKDDFINCIKNLLTEIEGILRITYFIETSKSEYVKIDDLLKHIIEKGRIKSGSDYSLLLPLPFLNYINEQIFCKFNLENGEIDLSRHTSSHGVAKAEDYTKLKAVQIILILDQLYFYI